MLALSITPLDVAHVEEISNDIIEQQRSGVSSCALFMMKLQPEGTPVVDKATILCRDYDVFRQRLDSTGAKHGILAQATMGHIVTPFEPYPFQAVVSLPDGKEHPVTTCPLDPEFRKYMRGQMRTLATRAPSVIMIDDDVGLLYRNDRNGKGCGCKYHVNEVSRRLGRPITREEIYLHTQGDSDEDKRITDIYVGVVRDSIVGFVREMRAGIDEVDPKIQGVVSGIYTSTFLEFSDDTARAFAGEGNPAVARLNGGPYAKLGTKVFTAQLYRAAIIRENAKGKIDRFLAETDTCPQNRYSTSAAHLHSHYTASILEGATGAKHWITRLYAFEPRSGIAYRRKLAKYSKFYKRLSEIVPDLTPFGCRIPLSTKQDWGFIEAKQPLNLAPWASTFLERIGVPLYFSNEEGGSAFLDDISVDGFTDEEIRGFMKNRLILSAVAARTLCERGFSEDVGVTVHDWNGPVISGEFVAGHNCASQYEKRELRPISDKVEWISKVFHKDGGTGEVTILFPGVTRIKNSFGGETVVFSGNPDAPFKYFTSFSLLNESRKAELISLISHGTPLDAYYPEDAEVYLRAGMLPTGEMMIAFFNLGHDELEDVPITLSDKWAEKLAEVEILTPEGERASCEFIREGNTVRIAESLPAVTPAVFFLKPHS